MPPTAPVAEHRTVHRSTGSYFLPKQNHDPNQRNLEVDYSRFIQEGIFEYKPLKGTVKPGIQFITHDTVSPEKLEWQRRGRIAATAGSVALNIMASAGLVYAGGKLIMSSLFGRGSEDEAYETLGSAYTKSSIAGVLTGVAHESPNWAIGNLGMGIFGRYLNDIGGLAGFLFSDGLASIGMGQVRFKEKGNAFAVQSSIFDNPNLSSLSFLKPIEQSIYSFGRRVANPGGWKHFIESEPYALFNTAGGGLVTAGGILGITSLFKNKLSDGFKSFTYLPAALLSLGSLIGFYRDGAVEVDRSHYIGGGKRKAENYTQRVEGYAKQAASPFLAVRNILFSLKGIGMDSSGVLHNLAIGMQAFGAASAFLGFTAQSFLKFLKPELFGAKFKQFIEIILEPKLAAQHLKKLMGFLRTDEGRERYEKPDNITPKLEEIVYSDKHAPVLRKIMKSDDFQATYERSQCGLVNYINNKTFSRFYLDRGNHMVRTSAIIIKQIEALKKNTTDPQILDELLKNELALKVAALLHDLKHGPFSHVLDKAIPGYDNDRETILAIRDENSPIHKTILEACKAEGADGKKVIDQILHILGRRSPFYPLISGWGADRIDYIRFSDFPLVNNGRVIFPEWDMKDLDNYVDTFRLYKDEGGNIRVGFTPEGALLAFMMCSDRELFDVSVNSNPGSISIDLLAAIALSHYSPNDIKGKSQKEVEQMIFKNIAALKNVQTTINFKQSKGARDGYSYYSPIPDDPSCINVVNGSVHEFTKYLEQRGIGNYLADLSKSSEIFRRYPISETELVNRIKAATTKHEFYVRVHARSKN